MVVSEIRDFVTSLVTFILYGAVHKKGAQKNYIITNCILLCSNRWFNSRENSIRNHKTLFQNNFFGCVLSCNIYSNKIYPGIKLIINNSI